MNTTKKINGVYKITNNITGKIYIGSSSEKRGIHQRWSHKYNRYLENSFKKYGKENFHFEILWTCESKDCLYFEQLYLDYYQPWIETGKGYNICKIAGNSLGTKHSNETKKVLSYNKKEKFKKEKHPMHGKKHTEESKNKMSNSHNGKHVGVLNSMFGKNRKSVERINKKTGEIKEYTHIRATILDGFSDSRVIDCCKNKRKSHGGFFWKYLVSGDEQ